VAFSNAFSPYLFKELTLIDKNRDETLQKQIKIVRIIKWCMLLIILFVIVAYLVSCLCIRWIYAPAYWDSIRFLPLVMLGQMFDGFYSLFVCFAHYTGKTKPLGAITFTWGMLSIFFSWAFISIFGSIGVAVSTAFTSLMIFVSVFILATKVYQLPWSQLLFIRSTKK
jgi:O-antigen/teichoic acid export membrane protein